MANVGSALPDDRRRTRSESRRSAGLAEATVEAPAPAAPAAKRKRTAPLPAAAGRRSKPPSSTKERKRAATRGAARNPVVLSSTPTPKDKPAARGSAKARRQVVLSSTPTFLVKRKSAARSSAPKRRPVVLTSTPPPTATSFEPSAVVLTSTPPPAATSSWTSEPTAPLLIGGLGSRISPRAKRPSTGRRSSLSTKRGRIVAGKMSSRERYFRDREMELHEDDSSSSGGPASSSDSEDVPRTRRINGLNSRKSFSVRRGLLNEHFRDREFSSNLTTNLARDERSQIQHQNRYSNDFSDNCYRPERLGSNCNEQHGCNSRHSDYACHERPNANFEERIARAIENSLASVRPTGFAGGDATLINRMTSVKKLQPFAGEPLDWDRFKQSFELATKLGKYTDKENVLRLSEALTGAAAKAVQPLFMTEHTPNKFQEIMDTLEMRFGTSKVILTKILEEIRMLPSIEKGRIGLIEFATRLRNAVLAIKSQRNSKGYLDSPELVDSLIKKLPNTMAYNFTDFAADETRKDDETPALEKLAQYVFKEAQKHITANIITYEVDEADKYPKTVGHSSRDKVKTVYATIDESAEENEIVEKKRESTREGKKCPNCDRRGHSIDTCNEFVRLPINMRWRVVKIRCLCFNCLGGGGHCRDACKKPKCSKCGRAHHELLHSSEKRDSNVKSQREVHTLGVENSHTSGKTAEINHQN